MHVCGNIYFASLSNFETFVCHQACAGALRALGLSLADSAPTQQWCGGRLFGTAAGFLFYKNGCFLETKSRTIKVQNRPSCRGLQTGHRRNPGSYSRQYFGAHIVIFGPKKSLLDSNHVLATTGKCCAKKKVPFSKINTSLYADFGCFLEKKKNGFSALLPLFGKTLKWPLLHNPGRDQAVVNEGYVLEA